MAIPSSRLSGNIQDYNRRISPKDIFITFGDNFITKGDNFITFGDIFIIFGDNFVIFGDIIPYPDFEAIQPVRRSYQPRTY